MKNDYTTKPPFAIHAIPPVAKVQRPLIIRDGSGQKRLNEEQLQALTPLTGMNVVNAGAGSGKSTVLVAKALSVAQHYPKDNMLLLTFSRKAALDLRDHIGATPHCYISTFHSLAYHILRQHGFADFQINTSETARDAAIEKLIGSKTETTVAKVVQSLNRLTDVDAPTETVREKYLHMLIKHKAISFDSMQPLALRLLQRHHNVLHALQKQWQFVMIDEAQDCDQVQLALINLLSVSGNVSLVGDDRQSIYAFRGAMENFMSKFAHEHTAVTEHQLHINYRSSPSILGLANKVMPHYEPMVAATDIADDAPPLYLAANDEKDEARHICRRILQMHKAGTPYHDIAVLYRSTKLASTLVEEMLEEHIPFRCKSGATLKLLHSPYIDIIRFFRYALMPDNPKLFLPLLPALYLPKSRAKEIEQLSRKQDCFLIHAATLLQLPFFQVNYIKAIDGALSSIHAETKPATAIDRLLKAGYKQCLGEEKAIKLEAWRDELDKQPSILSLLSHVDELQHQLQAIQRHAATSGHDCINLMTIHASKGLEFPCVFLIGAYDGALPLERDGINVEEERRLLYVAITRAKRYLLISYPIHNENSIDENKASRFLMDAFSDAHN